MKYKQKVNMATVIINDHYCCYTTVITLLLLHYYYYTTGITLTHIIDNLLESQLIFTEHVMEFSILFTPPSSPPVWAPAFLGSSWMSPVFVAHIFVPWLLLSGCRAL